MNRWDEEIDKITGRFLNSFSILSKKELNWKPAPEVWSIAQNMDHLINLNETYFPVFADLKSGTTNLPFIAKIGLAVNFFGKMILKSVQPENRKKMKTFSIWEPGHSDFDKGILDRFEEHQNRLKQEISEIADKTRENVVISSPANKNIVYKLETALDILVTHEKRHYRQANEVYQLLKASENKVS
ncbi:hypothetical protein GCM10023115_26340 [Pontixanthobacter gangjinensis]|uniref:DinB family protein n=1 Tax=Christiangramia aestuarii TaxID=1028746 RepID=A0A7K1LMI9_9FLAO|nr:DinB family protein [Christiangramia aestuarii]MUP41871.1 DinB family protein [Christiangramia aestuarii]